MPVAIVAIVFGSFLLLMKMILSHRQEARALPPVDSGSTMRLSELESMMERKVQEALEPLVTRIDDLESLQLEAMTEKLLIEDGERTSEPVSSTQTKQRV